MPHVGSLDHEESVDHNGQFIGDPLVTPSHGFTALTAWTIFAAVHARSTDSKGALSVVQSLNHPSSTISQYLSSTSRCRSYHCTNNHHVSNSVAANLHCWQDSKYSAYWSFIMRVTSARERVGQQGGQTRFSASH